MRLSIITSRFPYPLEKGDKLRIYHQIRVLATHFEIQLLALSFEEVPDVYKSELLKFCKEVHVFQLNKGKQILKAGINSLSPTPLQTQLFYSKAIDKEMSTKVQSFGSKKLYFQLARTAEYLKSTELPKLIDFQDAFSQGMYRTYKKAAWYSKLIYLWEYKKMQKYEHKILGSFDAATIISEQDQALIASSKKEEIKIVANGVDFDFFSKRKEEKIYDLVFVGNMSYPPNIDAAKYLAEDIVPALQAEGWQGKLLLAGATPHRKVKALANEQVHISGWLDDIRDAYAKAKIFIAPMRIGTGLQNKLLEAMSMQLPVITSSLANNALGANENQVCIAGNKAEYTAYILELLQDEVKAEKLAKAGKDFVLEHYSWKAASAPLIELLKA